jgi:hypothetical protein
LVCVGCFAGHHFSRQNLPVLLQQGRHPVDGLSPQPNEYLGMRLSQNGVALGCQVIIGQHGEPLLVFRAGFGQERCIGCPAIGLDAFGLQCHQTLRVP